MVLCIVGMNQEGKPVYLWDIWPSREELQEIERKHVLPAMFQEVYSKIIEGNERWNSLDAGMRSQPIFRSHLSLLEWCVYVCVCICPYCGCTHCRYVCACTRLCVVCVLCMCMCAHTVTHAYIHAYVHMCAYSCVHVYCGTCIL